MESSKICITVKKPNFIVAVENPEMIMKNCILDILNNKKCGLLLLSQAIRDVSYCNLDILYEDYKMCLDAKYNDIKQEITDIISKHKTDKDIFELIENVISQLIKNLCIIQQLLEKCDFMMTNLRCKNRSNIFRKESEFIGNNIIIEIFLQKIEDKTILQFLDEHISDDLHHLELLSHFATIINTTDHCNVINNILNNTQRLFMTNIDRLSAEICISLIKLFNIDPKFIAKYRECLSRRLMKQRDKKCFDHEREMLQYITPHDFIDSEHINKMYGQIRDSVNSFDITYVLSHNANIIIKSDEFTGVTFDKDVCKFEITDKYMWDTEIPTTKDILTKDLRIYTKVFEGFFKQICEDNFKNNENVLDCRKSTGIITIVINEIPYNFLVTLQQMNVLIQIMNSQTITKLNLQRTLNMINADFDNVIDSLISCDLLLCKDDSYSINQGFFFKETDVSLISMIGYNETFDESFVLDVIKIINDIHAQSVRQIFDEYVNIHGVTNYVLISSIIKYMEMKNIIRMDNGFYVVNEK